MFRKDQSIDPYLGVPYAERFALMAKDASGKEEGMVSLVRDDFLARVARALLGEEYPDRPGVSVTLSGGTATVTQRGSTVYQVLEGTVTDRVDLPLLFLPGYFDARVSRGELFAEPDVVTRISSGGR